MINYKFLIKNLITSLFIIVTLFSCKKEVETRDYTIDISDIELEQPEKREVIIRYDVKIDGLATIIEKGIILTTDPEASYFSNRLIDTSSIDQIEKEFHLKLEGGLQFYVKPFLITSNDTIYGEKRSFMTGDYYEDGSGVTDKEGNNYKTVIIGNQEWMAQNLRTRTFCDGDTLKVVDSLENTLSFVDSESQLVLNYHGDDDSKVQLYGYYYAGYTIMDERNICPCGWRIPRYEDVAELVVYLGNDQYVGGKMKSPGILEHGTGNWKYPNAQANNLSGLNVQPAGYHSRGSSTFYYLNESANIAYLTEPWSSGYAYNEQPVNMLLQHVRRKVTLEMGMGLNSAFVSVRCIKD